MALPKQEEVGELSKRSSSSKSRRASHVLDDSLMIELQEQIAEIKLDAEKDIETELENSVFHDTQGKEFRVLLEKDQKYITMQELDAFCAKWSNDGQQIAVGTTGGTIEIYSRYQGRARILHSYSKAPCTALSWVDYSPSANTATRNNNKSKKVNFYGDVDSFQTLLTAHCDGTISLWDTALNKLMFQIKENNNSQTYALTYNQMNKSFVTAGSDRNIRVYDLETHKLKNEFRSGMNSEKNLIGHANRIFSLNFKPDTDCILMSGGWDDNLFVWDLRSQNVIRIIHGPHIAGQSVDIQGNTVLTASWRNQDCIETWDFMTAKQINRYDVKCSRTEPLLAYQASFASSVDGIGINKKIKAKGICAVAGSGANCVTMVDTKSGALSNALKLDDDKDILKSMYDAVEIDDKSANKSNDSDLSQSVDMISNAGAVFCVDFDPLGEYIVYGGSHGKLEIAKIDVSRNKYRQTRDHSLVTAELLAL